MKSKKFTVLLGALAGGLAGALVLIELLGRRNVRCERAARRYLGGRLFSRVLGAGDPVVFLPGYQGSTEFWGKAFDALADRRRLIFVDTLGFGSSPWPETPPTLQDHLRALRHTLGVEGSTRRVVLVAHSFGTLLAAYYAEQHLEEVDHVFLLGAPVFDGEEDARRRLSEISPMGALFSLNRFLARELCMLMCAARPLLRKALPHLRTGVDAAVVQDAVLHSWETADGAFRNILLSLPLADPLRRIGPKVTFLHGTADGITPLTRIRDLAARTGARVIETPDVHLSYPKRSAERIVELIRLSIS